MSAASDRGAELIQRARELAPALIARAEKTASERRIPDETIAEFKEAGLFRMLQPSRWGGLEVDPKVFFEVQMTVAAACPRPASTTWMPILWATGMVCSSAPFIISTVLIALLLRIAGALPRRSAAHDGTS